MFHNVNSNKRQGKADYTTKINLNELQYQECVSWASIVKEKMGEDNNEACWFWNLFFEEWP